MKKILTLSTGIVFLITILIAGGCGSATEIKMRQLCDKRLDKSNNLFESY